MLDLSLPCQAFMDAVHESWPSSQHDPAGRSGVACAIIVLRHLLSYFDPEDRQRFVDSLRLGRIPVLEQAVLHSDKDSLDSSFGKMKANLGADDLRFDKLMENSVMHDEIWDKQDFRLFLEVTYRASPDGPWGRPPHDLVLAGHDGLLHWDGYDRTLAEHVSGYFGEIDLESGARVSRMAACPRIIRMRYESKNKRLQFHHDLSRFEYRLTQGHAKGTNFVIYRCIAAVRLRDSPEGSDSVRLYHYGLQFVPKTAQPMSTTWQLPDPGEYMLYFAVSDIPLPEEPCAPNATMSRYGRGLHGWNLHAANNLLVAEERQRAAGNGSCSCNDIIASEQG
jgi:hypothetical protein